MKIKEILNTKIDIFKCGTQSGVVWYTNTLFYFLKNITVKNRLTILKLRDINKKDEHKAKEYKKNNITACTISATFDKYRRLDHIKDYTGLIAIDIDKDKNPDLDVEEAKRKVMMLPYVALSSLSCRGEGIWCLIPYNKDNDFIETFLSLREEFDKIGYVIDGLRDATRLRFASLDDNMLINTGEIEVYNKFIHIERTTKQTEYTDKDWILTKDDLKDIVVAIYLLVHIFGYTADEYEEWLLEGFRLATIPNKEVGLKLFTMISENSDNFKSYEDVEEKFDECCQTTTYRTNILGYYINKIKEYCGVEWRSRANELLKGKIIA